MSEKVDRHRAAYQKFFDAVNTGGWEEVEKTVRELSLPGFILHTISETVRDTTLNEFLADFKPYFMNYSIKKFAFVDCFSVGDMMASHVSIETITKNTNEKRSRKVFFVDRFVGDQIAEEWEWVL
jgi:hypothetical protein